MLLFDLIHRLRFERTSRADSNNFPTLLSVLAALHPRRKAEDSVNLTVAKRSPLATTLVPSPIEVAKQVSLCPILLELETGMHILIQMVFVLEPGGKGDFRSDPEKRRAGERNGSDVSRKVTNGVSGSVQIHAQGR